MLKKHKIYIFIKNNSYFPLPLKIYSISLLHQTNRKMKATIENLKANREEFISTLKSLFGEENLISKMNILKDMVEYSEMFDSSREIENIIEEMSNDTESRRKVSKSAEMIAEMAERRGEVWDSKKGKFVKF